MIDDGYDQQMQYQAQQIFRADDASLAADVEIESIFLKNELPWRFDSRSRLNHLAVSNNVFILHINDKTLQRRCLDDTPKDAKASSTFQEVQISDAINKVFLDPLGRLVIVSTREKRDVYILVSSANSLKLNKKPIRFPNTTFVLVSVSWCNRFLQQNDVVALLAGQDGSIYEVLIRPDGDCSIPIEVYPSLKTILETSRDGVTGIYCDVKYSYEDNSNIFVVITTQKALYYFEQQIDPTRKSDYFTSFFAFFRDATLPDLKYREFPVGNSQSEIQVFVKRKSPSSQILNRQFAWITAAGLFYTEIDPTNVQKSFLERSRIIDYHIDKSVKQRDEEKPPKSVALSEFHCLMMFPNENVIRAICTVNEKIVMIDGSMVYGKPVGYARDQIRDQLWQCTEDRVVRYTIKDERRDVWRVFMQKKEFQKALETCMVIDDPIETKRRQRLINSKHADHLFNERKHALSASVYATSDTSFEDVTLKFLALKDKEPLREYLQSVLKFQQPSTDSTQITILTLWLTDLFLNELDELRPIDSPTTTTSQAKSPTNKSSLNLQPNEEVLDEKTRQEKFDKIRRNFQYFLRKPEIQSCLKEHRSAMYDLLTSHGDLDDLILFAEHVQDYERVILLYLEREDYEKALQTLELLKDNQLLYKYSPTLIEKLPEQLINVWKKKNKEQFEPKELLPAMIAYSRAHPTGKAVLDFLKFCVQRGCIDKSIHNYLLSGYIKFDPSQIMNYLREQKEDPDSITYDPRYALRLCIDHDLKEESVFLYRMLNMYEEAVDTALQVSVKLAKECAQAVQSNDERTKKLWLKIASSVVTQGHDLNEVMEILDDCGNDLLKIEDVLPLFPDFETIDQFKKPIINSLERYNDRLNDLRTEMNDASKSIDDIRDDLAKYRTRCVATIDSNETCSLCEQPLMLQSTFYIFACSHYFHGDCLFTYVRRLMKRKEESTPDGKSNAQGSGQGNEQNLIQKDIDTVNRLQSIIASGIAPPSRDMESVQQELDDIVASQCVLCGETAVDYLDLPLDAIL